MEDERDARRLTGGRRRRDDELPEVSAKRGWRYHHLGIPTGERRDGERYLPALKVYVSGFDSSPYGLEWMRFEDDSPVDDLIRRMPHIAFEVDDIEKELEEMGLVATVTSPSEGVRVAMIIEDGIAVELIEFDRDRCSGDGENASGS